MNEECKWREDDEGVWHTRCGQAFVSTDGSPPSDHHYLYCPWCGKTLVEEPYREPHD